MYPSPSNKRLQLALQAFQANAFVRWIDEFVSDG
jgi:hypothetical protein